MTTTCPTCGRCAVPTVRPEGAAWLLAPPLKMLARTLGRWQRRHDTARLLHLDDRMLADIGVSRDELPRMLRGHPLHRPDWPEPATLPARPGLL